MNVCTAVGAIDSKKNYTITFKSEAHKIFYLKYLPECRYQDVYHKALVYCLGIDADTRNHVNSIYDFKTGLYIRLSVEDRDLDELKTASVSIQNQKVHLRNFLMCHPETASGEIREFIDDGYTGTNMDRPAFQEMMKLAREEQISCIVVKDFSRFGRNYLEVGNYLEQIFPLLGIRFISVDDGYDSKQNQRDVPGLDVVFKNIIHDYYSKELSVKEIQTKRNLSQKGLFLGAIPPFGYVRDPDNRHKLLVDPELSLIHI